MHTRSHVPDIECMGVTARIPALKINIYPSEYTVRLQVVPHQEIWTSRWSRSVRGLEPQSS